MESEKQLISECVICYENNFKQHELISCNHAVCHDCFIKIQPINNNILCPICRKVVKKCEEKIYGRLSEWEIHGFENEETFLREMLLNELFCFFETLEERLHIESLYH